MADLSTVDELGWPEDAAGTNGLKTQRSRPHITSGISFETIPDFFTVIVVGVVMAAAAAVVVVLTAVVVKVLAAVAAPGVVESGRIANIRDLVAFSAGFS